MLPSRCLPRPVLALAAALAFAAFPRAQAGEPKAVPRMQAVPLPEHQVSFQRDGVEIARYHFGTDGFRPFVFPVIGPSGRMLTRMGHPHDPETHSHHNSVWLSHQSVNGVNFWTDNGGTIAHQRIEEYRDGPDQPDTASIQTLNVWMDKDRKHLINEHRRTSAENLENGEWLLVIDSQLEAAEGTVTLGQSPFGLIGVRMAKTIGVNDGGGTIRNSEGGVDEKGCFRLPARWVDYSGPVAPGVTEGITLMDHPGNPHHPEVFHVRNDGWMGAALTYQGALEIEPGKPLQVRYGLYIHSGMPAPEMLQKRWEAFASLPLAPLTKPTKPKEK
jgi:hypothetical protein